MDFTQQLKDEIEMTTTESNSYNSGYTKLRIQSLIKFPTWYQSLCFMNCKVHRNQPMTRASKRIT
jgi:hypothetical protein